MLRVVIAMCVCVCVCVLPSQAAPARPLTALIHYQVWAPVPLLRPSLLPSPIPHHTTPDTLPLPSPLDSFPLLSLSFPLPPCLSCILFLIPLFRRSSFLLFTFIFLAPPPPQGSLLPVTRHSPSCLSPGAGRSLSWPSRRLLCTATPCTRATTTPAPGMALCQVPPAHQVSPRECRVVFTCWDASLCYI